MKPWKWAVLVALVVLGTAAVYGYDRHRQFYPTTEDAYLDANAVRIAAQVSGPVERLLVSSQQRVRRGEPLLAIDDTLYRARLQDASAQLALARRQVDENRTELAAAEATLNRARVNLDNADRHRQRIHQLEKSQYLSIETAEDAEADYRRARAELAVAEAGLDQARARLSGAGGRDDLVLRAEAAVASAKWELEHTVLTAPCDGIVEEVDLYRGASVRAHMPLFVLVCGKDWWVRANFKETQLERMRPGQPVTVSVDMYPGHPFHGVVDSISPASGTAFSMLPAENATGNWVKVTQRVPVRIRLQDVSEDYPLRVGTSAVVEVDTVDQPGA